MQKTAKKEVLVFNKGTAFMLLTALDSYIKAQRKEIGREVQAYRKAGNHEQAEYYGGTAAQGMAFVVEIYNQIAAQCGEDAVSL